MGKNKKNITIPNHILPATNLRFSFEFYDTSCDKYCLSSWSKEQIAEALKRLKEICDKKFNELHGDRVLGFKPVDWTQTIEKKFPSTKANLLEAFHFSLIGINNQKARVYGAYGDNTFFIVWFDIDHKIWPTFKKNT